MRQVAAEQLRQARETFNQNKSKSARWFRFRLAMGRACFVLLIGVAILCAVIVADQAAFPPSATGPGATVQLG